MTAVDLLGLGIFDAVVKEPLGGAHADPDEAARLVKAALRSHLDELLRVSTDERLELRYQKFRRMGDIGLRDPGTPEPLSPDNASGSKPREEAP